MILRSIILATAFVAAPLAPALAAQPEKSAVDVRYDDLDLASVHGAKTFRHRIAIAIEGVCGSYSGAGSSGTSDEYAEIAKCRVAAQAQMDRRFAMLLVANTHLASFR